MANKKDRISDSIKKNDIEEQKNQSPIVEEKEAKEKENPNVDEKESVNTETPNSDGVENPNIEGDSKEDDIEENPSADDVEFENNLEKGDNGDKTEDKEKDIEEIDKNSYVVVYPFRDLEDKTSEYPNGYVYRVNDLYPREGLFINEKRIQELASSENKIGKILIEIKK